jgi:energy-coupling factor transporter ATP-binding protein EcfA2
MINSIELKNFAAFEDLSIDFSPKINVIIGENSCGKTQLLKAAYALNFTQSKIGLGEVVTKSEINTLLVDKLLGLFKPDSEKVGGVCNKQAEAKATTFLNLMNGSDEQFGCEISSSLASTAKVTGNHKLAADSGIFIPTKEVLSLLPAIANRQVNDSHLKALFDDTVFDLCNRLLVQPQDDLEKQLNEDPRLGSLLPDLAKAINGQYEIKGASQRFVSGQYTEVSRSNSQSRQARFYSDGTTQKFTPNKTGAFSTSMTAEGYRKIGVLQRLLENGELSLADDSPLFWDEPESNMNPKLMKAVVTCLLELSRNGKQIILASHDYVLLKWFDLLVDTGKGDHIRYHALLRNSDGEVEVETTENYKMLNSNAIADTFSDLYDAEIERSLGDG